MNYREQTQTGTTWRRCHEVHLYNPLNGPRFARMEEQDILALNGTQMIVGDSHVRVEFDHAGTIPLRDPETGDLTGQHMTHAALYQALYSLYIQTAMARDAEEQNNA